MGAVDPLQGRGRDVAPSPEQTTPPPNGEMSLQDFMDGKLEFALTFSDEYLEGHVVGLDQMILNKLRAGGLSPEAHLDLHGLNALQAFEALRGFFKGSWYKGLRTVLVVPGRGRNSPDGMGVLRERSAWAVRQWAWNDSHSRRVLFGYERQCVADCVVASGANRCWVGGSVVDVLTLWRDFQPYHHNNKMNRHRLLLVQRCTRC